MLTFLYWMIVIILAILCFLFALNIRLQMDGDPLHFNIRLFGLPLWRVSGRKMYQKFAKLTTTHPTKKAKNRPSILEYVSLVEFIHLDRFIYEQTIDGRYDIFAILDTLARFIAQSPPLNKVSVIVKQGEWNSKFRLQIHFQIGIVFINYLLIRRDQHA